VSLGAAVASLPTVLALAGPRYPEVPAVTAVHVGWLLGLAALGLLVWGWSRAESLRRAVLGRDDPRVFAMLRIAFAAITLITFVNMLPIADLLWSDEGMFDLASSQRRWGARCLEGWTSVDGFLGDGGWPGFFHFVTHRPSLLVLHGSPRFVHAYLAVFFASLVCFGIGFRTRAAGVIAWFLMIGLYNHNSVYLEGTDTVLRCMWWVLLFARTDAAWSVDAWIRRRTEARRVARGGRVDAGRLVDRLGHWVPVMVGVAALLDLCGQPLWPARLLALLVTFACVAMAFAQRGPRPAEEPLEPVPRFPRLLIMLQLAAIYLSTGLVKTGIEWRRGDALHYAISNPHLARFEAGSLAASRVLGSNLFHVATWVTLTWEVTFGLVLLGAALRFDAVHRRDPWSRAERGGAARMWIGRAGLFAAWVSAYFMARTAYPYMLALGRQGEVNDPTAELRALSIMWWVVVPLLVAAWWALRGRRLVVPLWSNRRLVFDRAVIRRWVLGRRVWLGVGAVFHGLLVVTLNIGMFPFVMLAAYLAFFESDELLAPLAGRRRVEPSMPANAATRASRARVPLVALALTVCTFAAVVATARLGSTVEVWSWSTGRWFALPWAIGLAVAAVRGRPFARPAADPRDGPGGVGRGPPLIVGPARRVLVAAFVLLHGLTVVALCLPTHAVFDTWRRPLQRAVMPYAELAHVRQGWRMFAPNPPRSTSFMRTVVETGDGTFTKMGPDFFDDRPTVFWINDRRRKMHRRMVGKGTWYLTPWGEAHCRLWMREHGEPAQAVIVERIDERIVPPPRYLGDPSPGRVRIRAKRKQVRRVPCGDNGGVDAALAERWGLPVPAGARAEAEADRRRALSRAKTKRARWEASHD